jgi:transposase-like protein
MPTTVDYALCLGVDHFGRKSTDHIGRKLTTSLDEAICALFVQGVSTLRVGAVPETLTDSKLSPNTVSRVFHTVKGEFESRKKRHLAAHYLYIFVDGTYFSVIYSGEGHKVPVLVIVDINTAGEREVLAFTIGRHETRPPGKMRWGISSNGAEKADQEVVAFCEKYAIIYPTAIECLNRDLEACLTFYAFPKAHRKTIRTTGVIDWLFGEVKKRSHRMGTASRNDYIAC